MTRHLPFDLRPAAPPGLSPPEYTSGSGRVKATSASIAPVPTWLDLNGGNQVPPAALLVWLTQPTDTSRGLGTATAGDSGSASMSVPVPYPFGPSTSAGYITIALPIGRPVAATRNRPARRMIRTVRSSEIWSARHASRQALAPRFGPPRVELPRRVADPRPGGQQHATAQARVPGIGDGQAGQVGGVPRLDRPGELVAPRRS